MTAVVHAFNPEVDFCRDCGALLPPLSSRGDISCLFCKTVVKVDEFQETEVNYVVKFNKVQKPKKKVEDAEGPVIERTCPKCKNDKMSFATLQLRSADEGQTVFFTCTKCGFKESENS
eukprot:TRINITY_DN757_c0_g2_i2.p1 TRINITY_DN757_c0_g2~~TRINITY_DN757_c0_g2_i2.p1  ORF type:complete len:118 (-),score=19.66 TRINITY_DN757_c0_g2_i2:10-363(-)